MIIPQSTIVGFYLVSILQITILFGGFVALRQMHKYKFTSVILGFAVYFASSELLNLIIYEGLAMIQPVALFLASASWIYYLVHFVISGALVVPLAYLVLKYVRRGKWNVYEAMGAGLGYSIYNTLSSSFTILNQAKIAEMANNGTLSQYLEDGTVTQEQIDEYLASLNTSNLGQSLLQILFFMVTIVMMVDLFILVYHGVKRKKARVIFIGIAAFIFIGYTAYLSSAYNTIIYGVLSAVYLALLVYAWIRYFQWYRQQQENLRQQRQEFKDRKAAAYRARVSENEEKERQEKERKEKERFASNLAAAAAAESALKEEDEKAAVEVSQDQEKTENTVSEQKLPAATDEQKSDPESSEDSEDDGKQVVWLNGKQYRI